jgi:hypothetical protein
MIEYGVAEIDGAPVKQRKTSLGNRRRVSPSLPKQTRTSIHMDTDFERMMAQGQVGHGGQTGAEVTMPDKYVLALPSVIIN